MHPRKSPVRANMFRTHDRSSQGINRRLPFCFSRRAAWEKARFACAWQDTHRPMVSLPPGLQTGVWGCWRDKHRSKRLMFLADSSLLSAGNRVMSRSSQRSAPGFFFFRPARWEKYWPRGLCFTLFIIPMISCTATPISPSNNDVSAVKRQPPLSKTWNILSWGITMPFTKVTAKQFTFIAH